MGQTSPSTESAICNCSSQLQCACLSRYVNAGALTEPAGVLPASRSLMRAAV